MKLRTIGIVVRTGADIVQCWLKGSQNYSVLNCTFTVVTQQEGQSAEGKAQWEQEESLYLDNLIDQSPSTCSCSSWEWNGGYCARSTGYTQCQWRSRFNHLEDCFHLYIPRNECQRSRKS